MSVQERINQLISAKSAIKTAINNKGGTVTDDTALADYATAIDNLSIGGDTLDDDSVEDFLAEIENELDDVLDLDEEDNTELTGVEDDLDDILGEA